MSVESQDRKVNLSTGSLWPLFSFASSQWSLEVAQKAGFDQIEILSGYSVIREFKRNQSLSIDQQFIGSFHENWREDALAENTYQLKTDTNFGIRASVRAQIIRSVFPPIQETRRLAQGLEKVYGLPFVFHWKDNLKHLDRNSVLEVHPYLGMGPEKIVDFVQNNPKISGLVIDLSERKFGDYLKKQAIPESSWKDVFDIFAPYLQEVHFQMGNKEEIKEVISQNHEGSLGQRLSYLKKLNREIPIVAEVNPGILKNFTGGRNELFTKVSTFIRKA